MGAGRGEKINTERSQKTAAVLNHQLQNALDYVVSTASPKLLQIQKPANCKLLQIIQIFRCNVINPKPEMYIK